MRTKSLSFSLTVYSVLLVVASFFVFAAVLYGLLQSSFSEQDNHEILDRVQTLQDLLEQQHGDLTLLHARVEHEWPQRRFERIYVRVIDQNGNVISQTPSDLPARIFSHIVPSSMAGEARTLSLDEGFFLVGEFRVVTSDAHGFNLQIALDRTNEANLLQMFKRSVPIVMVITMLGCLILSRVIVRQALRPVEDISKSADKVNSESLKERISLERLPVELHGLGQTLNLMFDRLDESFDRLSRFSADISHELRTPLNNLMGTFSVALSRQRTVEEYEAVLGSGIEDCERLKRIIDSLLFISKSHDPAQNIVLQKVSASEEISKIFGFYQALAQEAGIELVDDIQKDTQLFVELTLFQRALGNLLTNSIRHSSKGTKIVVKVSRRETQVIVSVIDQGSGIDAGSIDKIGQRFFRIDPSRSKISGGMGLGLSIVKSIMRLHRGTFHIETELGHGTRIDLGFPVA